MPLEGFIVKSKIKDYRVNFIGEPSLPQAIISSSSAIYAVDENVWRLHRDGLLEPLKSKEVITVKISEKNKTLNGVESLYDRIIERAPKKNSLLVAIGGGILQDIAGFTASTLYRGINWIFFPTTLLAQCDSCIGAKTSLNYKGFKNLIGTFYPPLAVNIHQKFLVTQIEADYLSGVGELVKLHLIGGSSYTNNLLNKFDQLFRKEDETMLDLVKTSLVIKKRFIEEDEFDAGRRNMLNFGHCFGHALETATDYAVSHGQAVVMGILLANNVAVRRGIMSNQKEVFLREKLLLPILKLKTGKISLKVEQVIDAMKKDKKRTGDGLALVMLGEKDEMFRVNDLSPKEVGEALSTLAF